MLYPVNNNEVLRDTAAVRLGTVWFGYISFLYFITRKLGKSATVPVSTAYK